MNLQSLSPTLRWQQSTRGWGTTVTCRIQVIGIGVVAKHGVKVDVKALRVLWLLRCRGA